MGRRALGVRFAFLLAAMALGAFAASGARADTFQFKSGRTARGRVLAEFRDHYYVQLGSELPRFVSVGELDAVLDDQDLARPPSRSRAPTPAFALGSVVGDVRLEPRGGASQAVSDVTFARPGDRVVTGEGGLVRLAFASQAVAKLGAQTAVTASGGTESKDALALESGEAFVAAESVRPFELVLASELRVSGQGATFEVARRPRDRSWRVTVHSGEARVEGTGFRLGLANGQAITLDVTAEGLRVSADAENGAPVDVSAGGAVQHVLPGKSLVVNGSLEGDRGGGTWTLIRMRGSVWVRRSREADGLSPDRFVPVAVRDVERTRLEDGDEVRTDGSSEAVLVREDGAELQLGEVSELSLAGLDLRAGSLRLDLLRAPASLATPAGKARLSFVSLEASRPRAHDASLLHVAVLKGEARLPLPASRMTAAAGTRLSFEGTADEARVTVTAGTARFASVAQVEAADPGLSGELAEGQALTVRALHAEGMALLLDGKRELRLGPGRVGARLVLEGEPRLVFNTGQECSFEAGSAVAFTADGGAPVATTPAGAPDAARAVLEGPGLRVRIRERQFVFPDGTIVSLRAGNATTLRGGEGAAGAIVSTRRDDRFEVPRGARVEVGRRSQAYATFRLDDGRGLWIEDGAPPVHERLSPEGTPGPDRLARTEVVPGATLNLGMPGAPPLAIASTRRVTVLATRNGEFVILDDPALLDGSADRAGLLLSGQTVGSAFAIDALPNHIPDLLAQPPPASPTTPP